jgi:hypothetical protein
MYYFSKGKRYSQKETRTEHETCSKLGSNTEVIRCIPEIRQRRETAGKVHRVTAGRQNMLCTTSQASKQSMLAHTIPDPLIRAPRLPVDNPVGCINS